MKTKFIIGADISKDKINFCLFIEEKLHFDKEVANESKELEKFIKEIQSFQKSYTKEQKKEVELCFSCEFTGIYNNILVTLLHEKQINTFVLHAPNVKMSLGLSREKNDIVDARMIAEYTFRFSDKLKLWTPSEKSVAELKHLESQRSQYVHLKKQLTQAKDDQKKFMPKSTFEVIQMIQDPVLDSFDEAINKIEKKMKDIIEINVKLKESFDILTSIPGIGPVNARAMICVTNNFIKFTSAKQYACYCGVVPFGKSSGKVKGKNQVSKMANMELKKLIHLGAMSLINTNNKFGQYYRQKIGEGKHHMLAVNNLRNKLITTAFGCISKGIKYREDYIYTA
jgi:transposase